jgi:predicted secreted protein/uncharacterized cupin superfamily protein
VTFENSAGPKAGQAVAVNVWSDQAVFRKCRFLGWQDTLYTNRNRQYFEDCYIDGSVDYIFGGSMAWFERCHLHCKGNGSVTAASTALEQPFGYVFSNCVITAEPGIKVDLGRPWRDYASVAYLNTVMPPEIQPYGWNNWGNPSKEKTARYAEFGSITPDGKPVDVSQRVPWARQLTGEEAAQHTIQSVLGGTDRENPFSEKMALLPKPPAPDAKPQATEVRSSALDARPVVPKTTRALLAKDATIQGTHAQLENDGDNLGYWSNPDTQFTWQANLPAGKYRIILNYALDSGQVGSEIQVSAGDQTWKVTPPATGGWQDYQNLRVGEVELKPGVVPIAVSALSQKKDFILNLRKITLEQTTVAPLQDYAELPARAAEIQGGHAQLENDGANLGFWSNTDTQFQWQANLNPGVYTLTVDYALAADAVGSEISLKVGNKPFRFFPGATGGWDQYLTVEVGDVEIKEPGPTPVIVSALAQTTDFILNLRKLTLSRKN